MKGNFMIYKLEVGMEIDFERKYKGNKEIRTMEIIDIPNDKNEKITVLDKTSNKEKKFTREVLKRCKRHIVEKEKKESAISIAIKVLERENRPVHIDELIDLIFDEGYVIPRGGKTFKNTISTSLNNECAKNNGKLKKVYYAVYAVKSCDVPYKPKKSRSMKEAMAKAFA